MELTLSIISLVLSIGIGIYNIKLNKKIYGPKIRVLFDKVYEHDEYGNFIEGRYAKYNIIITNDSIYNIYDFSVSYEFYNQDGIIDYKLDYEMGLFKEKVPCFVPGQKYTSYFANFTDLKKSEIKSIRFYFKYKINSNSGKYQKEIYDVNVITLSDSAVLRVKAN